jgi:hypothetical protein
LALLDLATLGGTTKKNDNLYLWSVAKASKVIFAGKTVGFVDLLASIRPGKPY